MAGRMTSHLLLLIQLFLFWTGGGDHPKGIERPYHKLEDFTAEM